METLEKRIYNKQRYEMLKRSHLCTKCKKQDAYTLNGWSRCFECNEKRRKKPTEFLPPPTKNIKKHRELGVRCWICNSEKPLYSKSLCKECYDKAVKSLELGRIKLKEIGYRWGIKL